MHVVSRHRRRRSRRPLSVATRRTRSHSRPRGRERRHTSPQPHRTRHPLSHRLPPRGTLRFVTWNCLTALPQFYDDLPHRGEPQVDVRPSLAHNGTRHDVLLRHLEPHLQNVQRGITHAVCLQEVDGALLDKLFARVRIRSSSSHTRDGGVSGGDLSNVYLHTSTAAYVDQSRIIAPHDSTQVHAFTSWFVTLVPRHLLLPKSAHRANTRRGRFLVTHTKVATMLNVHVPWVPEDQCANRAHKNEATVRTLASFVRRTSRRIPVFVLGDMNHSCPLNQRLYAKHFGTSNRAVGQVTQFGESYKLDKDNIAGKKTFGHIEMTPDDGLVCPVGWRVRGEGAGALDVLTATRGGGDGNDQRQQPTMQATALDKQAIAFQPLARKRMPVDANGWFVDMSDGTLPRYPSDHALVEVEVGAI